MTQAIKTNFLQIAVEIDSALGASHDDGALQIVSGAGREIKECRSKPREIPTWRVRNARPAFQVRPHATDIVLRLPVAAPRAAVGVSKAGKEEKVGVAFVGRFGADVSAQVGERQRGQRDDAAHAPLLSAAEVDGADAQVYGRASQVSDFAVVHRGEQAKAQHAPLGPVGGSVQLRELGRRVALGQVDPLVADIRLRGPLELRAGSVTVDELHADRPAVERPDAAYDAVIAAGLPRPELDGEGGEDFGPVRVSENASSPNVLAELVQDDGQVVQGPGPHGAGLAGRYTPLAGVEELAQDFPVGPIPAGQAVRPIQGFALLAEGLLGLIPRGVSTSAPDGSASIGTHPSAPRVGGESGEPFIARRGPIHCAQLLGARRGRYANAALDSVFFRRRLPTPTGFLLARTKSENTPDKSVFIGGSRHSSHLQVVPRTPNHSRTKPSWHCAVYCARTLRRLLPPLASVPQQRRDA